MAIIIGILNIILCLSLLALIRLCFGFRLSMKVTHSIYAYNQLCWLQNKSEYYLNYDKAEKPTWYQMLCPWVISVRQCLTKEAWEKVKSVKGREKEIITAANQEYDRLCEEIKRLKNV